MRTFAALAAATSLFTSAALADVDPIVIKGSKFFYKSNSTQFYIRGVAYQQDYGGNGTTTTTSTDSNAKKYNDPLSDPAKCKRDIPYLVQLRTNVIRTYALDPTANHDECMSALADAGIYLISDLSEPGSSINRNTPSWNTDLYKRYTSVIDAMAKYNNVLGFFAGNEVANSYNTTASAAFVKASVRDMKAYIKAKGYRTMGVGYASDDDATVRDAQSNFMNCGDASQSIDFWGYNIYEWCGESSFETSGYKERTAAFANYSVPVFFAEYGCNTPPRLFGDTPELFSSDMNGVWSGGIVFQYFQTDNNFGLVELDGNNVSPRADFTSYSSQIAKVTGSIGVQANAYTPTNSPRACPSTASTWLAQASPLPPTPNEAACGCVYDSLTCVVKSGVGNDNYGKLFGSVCGLDASACAGINTNSTNGAFGPYGMCNATVQLAVAFNQYYINRKSVASACDFGGAASTKSATSITGGCSTQIAQATQAVTGGSAGTSSGSGAGISTFSAPSIQNGMWQMTTLVMVACLSGMGMLLL